MICKCCHADEATAKYDRIADRWFIHCKSCEVTLTYEGARTRDELLKAYGADTEESAPGISAPEEVPQEEPKKKRRPKA